MLIFYADKLGREGGGGCMSLCVGMHALVGCE